MVAAADPKLTEALFAFGTAQSLFEDAEEYLGRAERLLRELSGLAPDEPLPAARADDPPDALAS